MPKAAGAEGQAAQPTEVVQPTTQPRIPRWRIILIAILIGVPEYVLYALVVEVGDAQQLPIAWLLASVLTWLGLAQRLRTASNWRAVRVGLFAPFMRGVLATVLQLAIGLFAQSHNALYAIGLLPLQVLCLPVCIPLDIGTAFLIRRTLRSQLVGAREQGPEPTTLLLGRAAADIDTRAPRRTAETEVSTLSDEASIQPPRGILIEEQPPLQAFFNAQLDEFRAHLVAIEMTASAIDHRMRGAEQFADWLLGHSRSKGEQSPRRRQSS